MQKEDGWWELAGNRFEEFKPSSESRVPTEWLIPAFVVRRWGRWLFGGWRHNAEGREGRPESMNTNGEFLGVDSTRSEEETKGQKTELPEKPKSRLFSRFWGQSRRHDGISV